MRPLTTAGRAAAEAAVARSAAAPSGAGSAASAAPGASTPGADVPAVEIRDLTVRYGDVLALEDATLRLVGGRVTGLIGLNGSGKSTLLKAVMGIVKPHAGSVRVLGLPPDGARRAGLVGYVPQAEDVDWTFPITVREVVTMGRYGRMGPLRRTRAADVTAVDVALERVDLAALADRQVGALSGGQRKRVFVARCLAQEAPVLLLDEPFAGVDQRNEAGITALLRGLVAEGRAVLVSTHDLQALPTLADEVVLLSTRVLATGRPDDVLQPHHLSRLLGLEAGGTSGEVPGRTGAGMVTP